MNDHLKKKQSSYFFEWYLFDYNLEIFNFFYRLVLFILISIVGIAGATLLTNLLLKPEY